jgi:hypothetical protein
MPYLFGAVDEGKVLCIVVCHNQRWAAHSLDLRAVDVTGTMDCSDAAIGRAAGTLAPSTVLGARCYSGRNTGDIRS